MVKKVLAKSFLWLVLGILYLPLIWIIVFSFTESSTIGKWTGDFTFSLYAKLFTGNYSQRIGTALLNTLIIGIAASLISTIIGTFGAIGIHNMRKRAKNIFTQVNRIPMLNAEIVTAVSLMILFSLLSIRNGYVTLIIAHTAFCTPYVVLNVLPKLRQMNPNTYEAALDLGASPFRAMIKVIVPQIMPGIVSGAMMAFTLSIDDFVITQYTNQNVQTLSTFIYTTAGGKRPLPPEVRALSALIFAFVLVLLVFINLKDKKPKAPTA